MNISIGGFPKEKSPIVISSFFNKISTSHKAGIPISENDFSNLICFFDSIVLPPVNDNWVFTEEQNNILKERAYAAHQRTGLRYLDYLTWKLSSK